jgi:hypothetical protein
MKIFDAHISGSLSVSSSAEISNDLLVSGNLNVLGTINGSISGSTTNADTASFAPKYSLTSSFNTFTSSYNTGSFTGSFKGDGSNLYNIPASGVTGLELNKIVNGSASASVLSDGTFRVNGDAYINGTLTAKEIHTSIVTSSVLYESGSTKFGDTVDDTHSFTGSVNITGSISLNGQAIGTGKLNETTFQSYTSSISSSIGSLSSSIATTDLNQSGRLDSLETDSGSIRTTLNSYTSSNDSTNSTQNSRLTSLESASSSIQGDFNSFTSSYNTASGSINNRLGSLESFSGSYTGSFTGSFKGDGTNLYNIPASGVTGLNLTRIADGSATASISSANGLRVNSNTEITGTLKLNKVELGGNNIVDMTLTDGGGKYFINGVKNPRLSFIRGFKYRFYYNNIGQHPLRFSLIDNGRHNGGTEYTTGVTTNADPFYIEVEVTDATAATLYYYCDVHVGMGNSITVYSDFLHGQSSIGLINVDTTALATTGSNNFTNIQRTSGSLVVTGSVDITGSITLNGQAIGTGKLDETTFQSYTSSNDSTNSTQNSQLTSIESATSSLNSFTSSIDNTIKNKLNTESVITGSVQVIITGTTGYSTFSSSISTSIGSLSGSIATTTSGLSSSIGSLSSSVATTTSDLSSSVATTTSGLSSSVGSLSSSIATTTSDLKNRVNSIETSTGSLNSFTSSINTTIKTKLDSESVISGSIQVNITGTTGYNTFSSSVATTTSGLSSSIGSLSSSVATTTSGLSSSIGSLSSSVATTTSGLSSSIGSLSSSVATTTLGLSSSLSSSIGSLSSSVATTTSDLKNRVDSIETSTGSLNSFTSSISTTIKDKMNSESVLSGSIQVNLTGTTGYSTFSSSIATTTSGLSSSVALTTSEITSTITSLSSSVATTTSGLSSSIGSLSSSVATTTLGTKNRVDSIESKTGSYATTGSNIFQGSQTITGSLYISQDLIVVGSSSIQHISSSIVNISDNIITVNALNPSVRFGGLAVIDSGSSPQVSGSILFDSINNQWLFVHQNQASVTSSVLLMGPETYDNLGNESYITQNRLVKSTGIEHLSDSNITDTGTLVSINSNTEITGTLNVTGNIINPNITAIQSSTGSLNTFTASLLSAIELTGSNLTVRGNLLVKGTTTNVNTSTLDVDNNLINLNGAGAANAGLRVKDTTGVSQLSGSLLWDATNDYWIAGQLGSEQRLVRETEFNNAVTRIGNVESSTGSLNSFTSSINTTIKSKLNSDGVLSGSVQVNHNATTNYVANQHIDHTTVSITAGSGLTGGGDISSTRTINVGAGNGITVNADDIAIDTSSATFTTGVKSKLNADGVVSGSSQIDGSQLGLNKTITIGSTSTTLGGTSTSLVGLVSVTSTAFTGSLQGNATNITATSNTSLTSLSNLNTIGTITGGTWNGTAIGDTYISSATNWNTAYNKRISTLGFTTSTVTITLADATTVTASVPTFNQNTTGTAANITASSNTSLTSLANLATVGTITTGVWNGTAIANAYLANSSFNIGTTSISLGRASASQTLTGVAIDGNAGSVTNGVYTTGDQTIGGAKTFSSNITNSATADWYMYGFGSRGASSGQYGMGLASDIANRTLSFHIPNHTAYSSSGTVPKFGWYSNGSVELMSLQSATGNLVVTGTIGASNLSGTNTGDETITRINALAITTVGTITSGVWNGSSISTTYTDAKVTSISGTANQVIASSSTGAITLSLPQSIHTTATPTFGGMVLSGAGTGNSPVLRINNSTASSFIHSLEAVGANMTAGQTNIIVVGASGTTKNSGYIGYNWAGAGSNSNYVSIGHWGADHLLRVYGDGTVYMGTVTTGTWQGSSISTTYTAAKVTAVNAGTGVGVDTTTGSVTVSIGQSVATSAVPTFKAAILTSDTDSRVLKLRELTSTSGNIIQFQDSAGNNKWEIVGRSNTDTTPFYIYKNDGTNTGYIFSISGGGIPNFHTALTIGGSTAKSISNSSYSTSFSSVSSVTVTHSLGTKDVAVFVYDSSDNMFWPSSIVTTSTSVVTITFASSRSGRVVVVR